MGTVLIDWAQLGLGRDACQQFLDQCGLTVDCVDQCAEDFFKTHFARSLFGGLQGFSSFNFLLGSHINPFHLVRP